jgi:hypothetical protein
VDTGTVLVSLGGALLTGGGGTAIVTAITRRGRRKADVAEVLTDTAMDIMAAFKADAKAAREDSAVAKAEVAETRRQFVELGQQAQRLAAELRWIIGAIHEPAQTLDHLRVLVPLPASTNGHSAGPHP